MEMDIYNPTVTSSLERIYSVLCEIKESLQRPNGNDDIEGLKREAEKQKTQTRLFGTSLDLILDEVSDPFARAQALRQLARDMRDWK